MKKTKLTRSLLAACSIVALSAVMYGCAHSGGDDAPATDTSGTPDPDLAPDPAAQLSAAEMELTAAQEAYDNLAEDATPEELGAATTRLAAARLALAAAENLPENMAAAQQTEVMGLIAAARTLVDALGQTPSQAEVDAANAAITAAKTALEGATALSSESMSSLGDHITALDMAAMASSGQEQFDARIARDNARVAKEAAVTAVANAVTAATTAAGNAAIDAGNASDETDRAVDARTDADDALTASTKAGEQETAANTAKGNADAAQTALDAAIAAFHAAQDDQDILTRDGAAAIMAAANTLKTAAEMATTAANKAMMDANTAAGMAMSYADMAMTSADTHVLGLFMRANAYDIDTPILDDSGSADMDESMTVAQQRATEVASIGAVMATAADATEGNQRGTIDAPTAAWPGLLDAASTPDEDESALNFLTITAGGTTSDTVGTPDDPDTDDDETVAPDDFIISGVDGFMHGFDMANEELRVIAFTDREQSVVEQDAVNFARYIDYGEGEGETIATTEVSGLGESPDGGVSYPGTLTQMESGAVMGTFTCTADNCSIALNNAGTGVTAISGYTFTGTRAAKAAVEADMNMDYLLFGLWLNEAQDGADSFGAFGGGGDAFETNDVNGLTGTASYSGEAVGAHHKTGEGVSWFTGAANLSANFGDGNDAGTIEGTISDISVAGRPALLTPINLARSTIQSDQNTFSGAAVMGGQTRPGEDVHSYNGTWSGGFFNNPVAPDGETLTGDDLHPLSVAGTFGVTRFDDMGTTTGENFTADDVTESFVGAFGAHR